MKKIYSSLPLIFFFILVIFFFRQLILKEDPSELPSVLIDQSLPIIKLEKLSEYKLFNKENLLLLKEPSLVNVWSSWCAPCKIEHEFLLAMSVEHNIKIFGINYKDDKKDAIKVLKLSGNPFYAIGRDEDGIQSINLGVYGVPETFVIDAKGNIRYRHVGPILEYDMKNTILPILNRIK
ncbi:MAG: DsbE family thiol:disulfide interchange protein [Alphaproteobacteria bacterium]|mgnify:FL=1|tara:strand:- start:573 stop:1109 length:537 start_codon:yes stop_codon:yes gene_type:complete